METGRKIIPNRILNRGRCVNIHPFLSKYKGLDPVGRALTDGETKGSVGAHYMTDEIDEGEVIVEEFTDISDCFTVKEIYNKLYPLYAKVVLKVLEVV